jgi:hypothetical protein
MIMTDRLRHHFLILKVLLIKIGERRLSTATTTSRSDEHEEELKNTIIYELALLQMRWRLFSSRNGYLGFCPIKSLPTDNVYILKGSGNPMILREVDGCFNLVGTCYIAGLMDGEAREMIDAKKLQVELLYIR